MADTSSVTIGLYAGSFDPPHLGHLSLIEVAARWCDTLYVVAAGNPNKAGALFDLEERRALLSEATRHLGNVIALTLGGLVAPLAASLGVDVLVRGMGKEQAIELQMAVANELVSGIPTVFLPPALETHGLSSRSVRAEHARAGPSAVATMVPPAVLLALVEKAAVSSPP